jgi:hypothetical protein
MSHNYVQVEQARQPPAGAVDIEISIGQILIHRQCAVMTLTTDTPAETWRENYTPQGKI